MIAFLSTSHHSLKLKECFMSLSNLYLQTFVYLITVVVILYYAWKTESMLILRVSTMNMRSSNRLGYRVQETPALSHNIYQSIFIFIILAALSRNCKTWFAVAFAPRWQSSPG